VTVTSHTVRCKVKCCRLPPPWTAPVLARLSSSKRQLGDDPLEQLDLELRAASASVGGALRERAKPVRGALALSRLRLAKPARFICSGRPRTLVRLPRFARLVLYIVTQAPVPLVGTGGVANLRSFPGSGAGGPGAGARLTMHRAGSGLVRPWG